MGLVLHLIAIGVLVIGSWSVGKYGFAGVLAKVKALPSLVKGLFNALFHRH